MAKRKRKGRQPNLPQEVIERAQAQGTGQVINHTPKPSAEPAIAASPRSVPEPTSEAIDLAQEYQYVGVDLQRVGLLSALIIVVLVALRLLTG